MNKKKRYLFPNRAEAEAAYEKQRSMTMTHRLAVNAVLFHSPAAELVCQLHNGFLKAKLYGGDHDSGAVENVDDQGGWPSDESLVAAFTSLGYRRAVD